MHSSSSSSSYGAVFEGTAPGEDGSVLEAGLATDGFGTGVAGERVLLSDDNEESSTLLEQKKQTLGAAGSGGIPRVSNRTVVTIGTFGLLFLTLGTFFLAVTYRHGGSFFSSSGSSGTILTSEEETLTDDGTKVSLGGDDEGSTSRMVKYSFARCNYSTITFFDEDVDSTPELTYEILKKHVGVIEPYAPMELSLFQDKSPTGRGTITYRYSLTDAEGNAAMDEVVHYADSTEGTSGTFTLPCTPGDVYTLTFSRYQSELATYSESKTVLCMYVRREFRSLTSEDLSAAMDAMYAMWEYGRDDGKQKFGDDFYEAGFFSAVHFYNAGFRDSDHIHEGLGFLPQHIKISNIFEKSMQAVDPSVSLFYWDFTIDTVAGLDVYTTPYFSADTFGSITQPKNTTLGWSYRYDDLSSARIPDGRWANLKAELNADYPELKQAYGYIRAPWNMNPNEYISRFSIAPPYVNLPGCGNYKEWFEDKDFSASMKESAYGPHSTTHTAIGGVYGCDALDTLRESGYVLDSSLSHQQSICLKWGFYIKEYYRGNYLTPDSDCTEESTSCFTCNEDTIEDMMSMMKSSSLKSYLPTDLSEDGWQAWQDFICHGEAHKIFVGDHLESASPADPSFWPIHPAQERLLQARYSNGGFWDYTWPILGTAGDYVCNHFECYDDETLELKTTDTSCCYGHYENDQIYWPGDKNTVFGSTNKQTLLDVDASSSNYAMSYIYDSFLWEHCGSLFDVVNLADTMALKALTLDSSGNPIDANELSWTATEDVAATTTTTADPATISSGSYSTVLASSSRSSSSKGEKKSSSKKSSSKKAVRGASTPEAVEDVDSDASTTSSDSKGYSTVLASDARSAGKGHA